MYGLQSGKNKKWIKWKWVAEVGGGGEVINDSNSIAIHHLFSF
jgi:hypothetical protein